MKMKFDKKAALELLVQYGERVVFACVVLCFLFFVYKSFARERYDKTPQDLMNAAADAGKAINSTEPSINKDLEDKETILETIERISGKIIEDPYTTTIAINPPIFQPRSKRGLPKLYTVEALRGTPGVGCFGNSGRMGGLPGRGRGNATRFDEETDPLGQRWVMLTGLVNLKKQIEAYRECFKNVFPKNSQTDQEPTYYAFWVERAEVTDSASEENLQWKRPYKSLRAERGKCGGTSGLRGGGSHVANHFILNELAFSVPALTNRNWGDEVAHPPEIPLLSYDDEIQAKQRDALEKVDDLDEGDDPGSLQDRMGGATGRRGMFGGMRPGMGMSGRMGPGMGMSGRMGPGMGMSGRMGPGMGMSDGRGGRGGMRRLGMDGKELSPYILFRFIDLNVEPGKQYRYRARIGFFNPNFEVETRYLIPELQEMIAADKDRGTGERKEWKEYIKSDWSEPTDVVAVPRDDQLLLAKINPPPPRKFDSEPKAKIMAVHWDMQDGIEVTDDFDNIRRGMVVNFLDHEVKAPEAVTRPGLGKIGRPGTGGLGGKLSAKEKAKKKKEEKQRSKRNRKTSGRDDPLADALRRGGPRNTRLGGPAWATANKQPEKVDFKTECLVLDLRGGQRLTGKNRDLYGPGEILLLDPDGNLVVRNDVADFDKYLKHKYQSKRGLRTRGLPGGMMGRGMMGVPGMMVDPRDR